MKRFRELSIKSGIGCALAFALYGAALLWAVEGQIPIGYLAANSAMVGLLQGLMYAGFHELLGRQPSVLSSCLYGLSLTGCCLLAGMALGVPGTLSLVGIQELTALGLLIGFGAYAGTRFKSWWGFNKF